MAWHVKADGTVLPLDPANGRTFTLTELQQAVGGYIEIVRARGRAPFDGERRGHAQLLVVNELGKIEGLPVNRLATMLFVGVVPDVIVGDVVLCRDTEVE